jgi:ATP-dependent Clp protease adaptor protein ClpS
MSKIAPEILEEASRQAELGPLCRVIIHNDEVTPMQFVVDVLRGIFLLSAPNALQVMYTAHYHGMALVDTLPKPVAQARVHQAQYAARLRGYPLRFTLEEEHG